MAFPPQKIPGRKDDLDRPWVLGDAIPAPEATIKDGESAWALFHEISQAHEQKYAETAPMTAPYSLSTDNHGGWAATQPASAAPVMPRREKHAVFTLEAAMLVARRNNRVCPRPERWVEFAALLPSRKTLRGMQSPPVPVTGKAWAVTPPLTKRLCFREQIEWAEKQGVLENAIEFMQAMPETDWLHMGED